MMSVPFGAQHLPKSLVLETKCGPRTEKSGVVPHREVVVNKVFRWITTNHFARSRRKVEEQFTFCISATYKAIGIVDGVSFSHMRANELYFVVESFSF